MQLHHLFIDRAQKMKNKTAVYDSLMDKSLSYQKFLISALILSKKLRKYQTYYIGILLPNSLGCFISLMATLFSGKVPVMINYSTGVKTNCEYAMQKCGFDTILTSKKFIEKLNLEQMPEMVFLEDIIRKFSFFDKIMGALKSKFAKSFVHQGELDDAAIILFTSGSEKEPKATQLSHRNIIANINGCGDAFSFHEQDIFLSSLPMFHVFGLTTTFFIPIVIGCKIVSHPSPLEYKKIINSIKKHQITILVSTPTFLYGYCKKAERGDLDSVRISVAGGDKLSKNIYDDCKEKHNLIIYEGYGTTETSPVISVNTEENYRLGSIGKPLNNVEVKIVGVDSFKELERNQVGKILVKGELVMLGYLDDLEETSMRIRDGWYDTGDMGYLDDDGFLWHKGRLKRFIKVGGEMISLVAIENKIESFLGVDAHVCVVGLSHPTKGSKIVAAITEKVDKKELLKKLRKELAPILMPKDILYFEKLPLLGSGKVDFKKVTAICQQLEIKKK